MNVPNGKTQVMNAHIDIEVESKEELAEDAIVAKVFISALPYLILRIFNDLYLRQNLLLSALSFVLAAVPMPPRDTSFTATPSDRIASCMDLLWSTAC